MKLMSKSRLELLAIHILTMPNREHQHQQDSTMHLIYNPIAAGSDPPRVWKRRHLLASRRKRIAAQPFDLERHSLLYIGRQFFHLSKRGWLELKRVSHEAGSSHKQSFFLTVSHGMVPGSFNASRAAAMSISSSSFSSSSRSSIGTTAATGFFPRCTITLSPLYAARLRMSEKFCRAALAVSFGAISNALERCTKRTISRLYNLYQIEHL